MVAFIGRVTTVRAAAAALAGAACVRIGLQPVEQQPVAPALAAPGVLLNTGSSVPSLGFGTYLTNGEELLSALLVAIRIGYRHIDTAAGYCNEQVVAAAIDESGHARSDFFITTKLWSDSHGKQKTQKAIAKSLRRLQTDYVDLYLIHAPDNQGESAEEIRCLRREAWLAMEEEHRRGALRAIGVSNFEPRHIEALLQNEDGTPREGAIIPAVNQIEVHPHFDQRVTRGYCAQMGIVVEAYGSIQGDGVLTDPLVKQLATQYGRTPAQIALRHTLQRGTVVLAKSLTPRRISENARIFDFHLNEEDCAALDALASDPQRDGRSYWDNSDVP